MEDLKNKEIHVLKKINIEIEKGSLVGIIGRNGSGKTSLLHSLIGETNVHSHNSTEVKISGTLNYVGQNS